ncbi:MAG: MerR family transcriptional regulator [Chloroflexota bacterium]|nr:MerR family transcriptional regulator [Chloroflexota bacterium]
MRISDLSRQSGIPIATIKFYLRERVLPPGTRTAPNQATYGEAHLRRLRLIRVLVETGGLSLAAVRRVVDALGDDGLPLHDVLGIAHRALEKPVPSGDTGLDAVRREVDVWIETRGWQVAPHAPARDALAATLVALRGLGWQVGPRVFDRYAGHMDEIAANELAYVAGMESREAAVEATVIGTVVFERAMVALRRLAQEHHSKAREPGP